LLAVTGESPTTGGAFRVIRELDRIAISVDWGRLPPAAQTFAADVARAVVRHGEPELQFVQTLPFNDKIATRIVVVRYSSEVFFARVAENEKFRADLETWVRTSRLRNGRAENAQIFDQLDLNHSEPAAVLFDADFELLVRTGSKSAAVFATSRSWDRHQVISGKANELEVHPIVEITMPSPVLLDLLQSWKGLASSLSGGESK